MVLPFSLLALALAITLAFVRLPLTNEVSDRLFALFVRVLHHRYLLGLGSFSVDHRMTRLCNVRSAIKCISEACTSSHYLPLPL